MKVGKFTMLEKELQKMLSSQRLVHSYNVAAEAKKLALIYNCDPIKAETAGLLHDITKELTITQNLQIIENSGIILDDIQKVSPKLLHAISGAVYARDILNIADQEILSAIRFHTTARADMSSLEKIIYLADYTSVDRTFDDAEFMRLSVITSLDNTLVFALAYTIRKLVWDKSKIHPDTFLAYNFYIS